MSVHQRAHSVSSTLQVRLDTFTYLPIHIEITVVFTNKCMEYMYIIWNLLFLSDFPFFRLISEIAYFDGTLISIGIIVL